MQNIHLDAVQKKWDNIGYVCAIQYYKVYKG